jgi:hypothetical protein
MLSNLLEDIGQMSVFRQIDFDPVPNFLYLKNGKKELETWGKRQKNLLLKIEGSMEIILSPKSHRFGFVGGEKFDFDHFQDLVVWLIEMIPQTDYFLKSNIVK